jgi:AcrR family transcriptional regulator
MAEEPRTRKAEQAEATRAELVAAARELFAERGYAAVPTEEIVARARVTRGALYHHFRDKRDLFRAVFEATDHDLVQDLARAALAEEDPWRRLVAGAERFLDACLDPAIRRIVFTDAPAVLDPAEWRSAEEQSALGLVAFALQSAMDAGALAVWPVPPLARVVLGALNEAGIAIATADDPRSAREEMGAALAHVLEGLRPRPT